MVGQGIRTMAWLVRRLGRGHGWSEDLGEGMVGPGD